MRTVTFAGRCQSSCGLRFACGGMADGFSCEKRGSSVREGLQADFIVIDLTEAWKTMGEITGDTMDDELIHSIFSRFCVGK